MFFEKEKDLQYRRTLQSYLVASCESNQLIERHQKLLDEIPFPDLCTSKIKVTHQLGRGGYGVVVKGVWKQKDVAVKVIDPAGLPTRNGVHHCREVEVLLNAIGDVNLLQMFGVYFDKNLFLVTELAKDSLTFLAPIPIGFFAKFTVQMVDTLAWLERKHLVHCDIKTCNILVTFANDAKLADFGECSEVKENHEYVQKKRHVGTLCKAHEYCNQHMRYGYRTDVSAVGIAIFEAFAGRFLLQSRARSFKKGPKEEAEFYVECFRKGRIKEEIRDGKCHEVSKNQQHEREPILDRICKNIQNKEFAKIIIALINPSGDVSGIPLASEILKSEWMSKLKTLCLNPTLNKESIELKREPTPVSEMPSFPTLPIADATLLALEYYHDAFATPPNESPRQKRPKKIQKNAPGKKKADANAAEIIDLASSSDSDSEKPPVKKFKCKDCGQEFTKANNLYRHKLIHKEKKYTCEICQRKFARPDNLKEHKKSHLKPIGCVKCSFKCKYQKELKAHCKQQHPNDRRH